jgi:acyl-CoA synthetase (AMP-forming)/AMP-acid ligase II
VNVPLTPLAFLDRAERVFSPLEGVIDGERRLTYGEFAGRCRRWAGALRDEIGVRPGDRVAYLCGNTLELLEAYYGVVLAGAVLTPLNIRLSSNELQFVLDDCGAAALVVHPTFADVDLKAPRIVRIGDEYEALVAGGAPSVSPDVDEDDVCELFYTSGSTGSPRGAMLTHRALATHAVDSALTMGLHHRDVVLHTIPLFHVNGWGTPHYVTALGGVHVLLERFDPGEVLRLIAAERVTRLFLVPTMATALLTHPDLADSETSSLMQVSIGGAPAGPRLLAELEDALGCEVICGYGLTEASPQLTKALTMRSHDRLPVEEQRRRRATTGIPNVGVELRVATDDGSDVPWDGTTSGEVLARSNHVMAGYWGRPEDSAAALEGGWLHTGDVATVDAEGYLTIVDRKKDLIVSGGENISSVQVENCLNEHPAVLESAVVGMAHERWGEVPRAFVVARPGQQPSEAELIGWVRDRLAHFKAPARVDVVDELPKGGTGKVQKRALRDVP